MGAEVDIEQGYIRARARRLGADAADTLVVYKSPTCGCCSNWVDHVEENGFAVVTHDISDQELAALKPAQATRLRSA